MKGVALLLIMLHNYFHIIPPIPGQSEFFFDKSAFPSFLELIQNNPPDFLRHFFSYFGHYGVTVFVFVSGYGSYISYKDKYINYFDFLKKKIWKLYPTLVIVVVLLFLFISFYSGGLPPAAQVKSLVLKLTLLFNFIPGEALEVDGPLWFFSLIVQLYALFPLLKYVVKKYGANSMLLIALIMLIFNILLNPFLVKNDLSVYFLFAGQLPVFCLGIYFASRPVMSISYPVFIFALLLFIASNFHPVIWHFSFMSLMIVFLVLNLFIKPGFKKSGKTVSFLAFTGSISLSLFAVHGMIRIPFEAIAEIYNHSLITYLLAFPFLAASYGGAWLIRFVEANSLNRILKKGKIKW